MEAKEYAYIRLFAREQNENRQRIAMVEYDIAASREFSWRLAHNVLRTGARGNAAQRRYVYFFTHVYCNSILFVVVFSEKKS